MPLAQPPLIMLVAHAPLATAFAQLAKHVWPQVPVQAYDVQPGDCPEQLQWQLVQQAQTASAVILLADLVGATPANIVMRTVQQLRGQGQLAQGFVGLNAGMLISALQTDVSQFEQSCQKIQIHAQASITALAPFTQESLCTAKPLPSSTSLVYTPVLPPNSPN